ncbi:thiamine-phosphate kinase [Oceanobacillus limi]|uniref:Thiamine-monophosphate kinase n=1 Tax=Oceanobacillus limi TaxID=930131 RepID=A0A1I0H165_9BACI|nr:thiamine-phosphate kinase [Oceanobacillus limi]SET77275.1 thiamine-phosphate kinase [Oceanobacillus limi]
MDEFSFIDSIKQKTYKQSSIIKGIGDDAAVFRQQTQDIVIAKDMFVEGVHFTNNTMEPYHIGYRALAANLSDLAAMGANPAFYLVAIAIPKKWSTVDLDSIYQGMKDLAKDYQMDLIGGDTVSGEELTISITVIGYVDKAKAWYRETSEDNDIVFVTGTLGDSQAGFHIINNPGQYDQGEDFLIKRHRMPTPRIHFARELEPISRVSLNDISDGIASEANEIAEASNVCLHLYDSDIPISEHLRQFPLSLQTKWKYYGGEDFELMGTVPEKDWHLIEKAAEKTKTKLSKIGFVSSESKFQGQVILHYNNDKIERLVKNGYNHLRR